MKTAAPFIDNLTILKKKGVFRHFLENFDRKIVFFRRELPPQN